MCLTSSSSVSIHIKRLFDFQKHISHGLFVLNTSRQNSARTYSKINNVAMQTWRLDQQHMNLTQPETQCGTVGSGREAKPWEPLTYISLWRPFYYKSPRFLIWWSLKSYQKLGTLPLPSFLFSSMSLCPAHSHPLAGLQMLQAHTPLGAIAKADFLCFRCSHFSFPTLLLLALVKPLISVLHKAS